MTAAPDGTRPDVGRRVRLLGSSLRRTVADIDHEVGVHLVEVSDGSTGTTSGEPIGTASVTSLTAPGVDPDHPRPLVVAFNGGPVVASMWLQLGGLGPERVRVPADLTSPLLPPFAVEPQPQSVLADADLLFVDPVGTGFGRYASESARDSQRTISADVSQVARTVTAWIRTRYRATPPLFLVGESYGTVRAVVLARELLEQDDPIVTSGIVLVGQCLAIQEVMERPTNLVAPATALPLMAAAAWYHGRASAGATLEQVIDDACEVADGPYARALWLGTALPAAERDGVAAALAELTGIPADELARRHLMLTKEEFRGLLMRDRRLALGRNDARYTARQDADRETDPSEATLAPAYGDVLHRLHSDLGIDPDLAYVGVLEGSAAGWEWLLPEEGGRLEGGFGSSPFAVFDYAGVLADYLARVPGSTVMFANGAFDTVTTVGAVDHLVRRIDLPDGRWTRRTYPAGHMLYTDRDSAAKLCLDIRDLIARTLHGEPLDPQPPITGDPR